MEREGEWGGERRGGEEREGEGGREDIVPYKYRIQ